MYIKITMNCNIINKNDRCAVKFDSWWKCDMVYHDERDRFDRNAELKDHKAYPCYKEFYES